FFFFQAEDGIRDFHVTGVQTCALPISPGQAGNACGDSVRCSLGLASSMLLLACPEGTSGQTLALASILTCSRPGPGASSSAFSASSTSARCSLRVAGMPHTCASAAKSGLSDRSISL